MELSCSVRADSKGPHPHVGRGLRQWIWSVPCVRCERQPETCVVQVFMDLKCALYEAQDPPQSMWTPSAVFPQGSLVFNLNYV